MNRYEMMLGNMLRCSLNNSVSDEAYDIPGFLTDKEWDELGKTAGAQKISGLLYGSASGMENIPERIVRNFKAEAVTTASSDLRLLFLSRDILTELEKKGIGALLLKGMATSFFYPVPLLRKSGDVDILIPDASLINKATEALEKFGLKVKEKQLALHHVVMSFEDKIDVELHTLLAEPFDNDRANRILAVQQSQLLKAENGEKILSGDDDAVIKREVLGVPITMLGDPFHAYELLLHMLQHYLRSGFGIRLLCDWVVFWNREMPERTFRKYIALTRECGIKGFSDMITLVSYRYLGLKRDAVRKLLAGEKRFKRSDIDAFWQDFINAGEFGKVSKDRMVALRGNGIGDYIREFHHQMRLNYPGAGRFIPAWPVLWIMTFVRFMINNRKIRNVSLRSVLSSAGKRGRMVGKLDLFI